MNPVGKESHANWRMVKKIMRRYYVENDVTPQQFERGMAPLLGLEVTNPSMNFYPFRIGAILVCNQSYALPKSCWVHLFGICHQGNITGVTLSDLRNSSRTRSFGQLYESDARWLIQNSPFKRLQTVSPEMAARLLAMELER